MYGFWVCIWAVLAGSCVSLGKFSASLCLCDLLWELGMTTAPASWVVVKITLSAAHSF